MYKLQISAEEEGNHSTREHLIDSKHLESESCYLFIIVSPVWNLAYVHLTVVE